MTKTNEDLIAKSSLYLPTSLKILPIHLSRVLAGECWNTINTAGIFLNKQKVTLNGSEDLPTVCGGWGGNEINSFTVSGLQIFNCHSAQNPVPK